MRKYNEISTIEIANELNKKRKKDKIFAFLALALCLFGATCVISGCILSDRYSYNYRLNNPPDVNWVEEDLEPIFMTTGVCILDTDNEGNHIYYKASANGFYYKVHYAIAKDYHFNYCWKYQNHIQIREIE